MAERPKGSGADSETAFLAQGADRSVVQNVSGERAAGQQVAIDVEIAPRHGRGREAQIEARPDGLAVQRLRLCSSRDRLLQGVDQEPGGRYRVLA